MYTCTYIYIYRLYDYMIMVLYLRIDCVQHKDPTGDITE